MPFIPPATGSTFRLSLLFGSLLISPTALGQHADFVLFGDPNPAAANETWEETAVHPITAPYYHEDAFITSDVRAWFVHHDFPDSNLGGDAQVYALQIRLALTDRLQLVAYKDGYTVFDDNVVDESGWNDIAAGLKYAIVQDFETDFHWAVGAGYQFAFGDADVLQNDQELRLWTSVNKGFGPLHLGGTFNYLIHTGHEDALGSSDRITWHLHADYAVCEWFSPVIELNGYHTVDEGDNTPLPFSGVDVANLGGGGDEDVVTMGVGGSFIIPDSGVSIRAAYEWPLTDYNDLFGDRITLSLAWSF